MTAPLFKLYCFLLRKSYMIKWELLFMSFDETAMLHFQLISAIVWAWSSKFVSFKMSSGPLCSNGGISTWQMAELHNYLDFLYSHQEPFEWDEHLQKSFQKHVLYLSAWYDWVLWYCVNIRLLMYAFSSFFSDFVVLSYVIVRVTSWFQQHKAFYGNSYLVQVFLLTTQLWKVKTNKSILNISLR